MEQPSSRQTYIATEDHTNDQLLQNIQGIKGDMICSKVLEMAQKNFSITSRSQLTELFLKNPRELVKLIRICLMPETVNCQNSGWPFLADAILKKEPPLLTLSLLDPPSPNSLCLFEFLPHQPNQTALGYFAEIMGCTMNDFQDKLLNYLQAKREILELLYKYRHYLDVFMVLFNCVIYSSENRKQFQKQILIKLFELPEENSVSISQNILQMIKSTNESLTRLTQPVCSALIDILDSKYVSKLINIINYEHTKNQQLCQNLLEILCQMVELYEQFLEMSLKEKIQLRTLESGISEIIKSTGILCKILQEPSENQINFSSGESITTVGLLKYYTLKLMNCLLHQPQHLVKSDIDKNNILFVLQPFLTANPWSSMTHRMVQEIVTTLINSFETYAESEQTYIGPKGFLAFLIETFRNQSYFFLESGNVSTYGYMHPLYKIATTICTKLQQSEHLKIVMKKFEPWQKFVVDDLKKYEEVFSDGRLGEDHTSIPIHHEMKEGTIRKIVWDLKDKAPSIMGETAEDNKQENDFFEQFVRVIKTTQKFNTGRKTMIKKGDSPRRGSKDDLDRLLLSSPLSVQQFKNASIETDRTVQQSPDAIKQVNLVMQKRRNSKISEFEDCKQRSYSQKKPPKKEDQDD